MSCLSTRTKTSQFTQYFQHSSRLACFSIFVLSQSLAWAETEESEGKNEATQLETFVITGSESESTVLEQSAAAVNIIDLKADQKLTADLSEVLSRETGISIRRMGGLGSRERFSLNGLENEQIRFFIDGIPLEMSGYTFGISSIPVNLISRADIYHGVVPIELGADALGGAVNFITNKGLGGTGGSVSHKLGDFNTTQTTLNLNYTNDNGFFSRLNGFYDYSDNNYNVDVQLANKFGTPEVYEAERFHDAYEGHGANVDFGFTEQSWANLFQMSLYTSEYFKEIQHNISMQTVYGEATVERKTYGLNLRYEQDLTDNVSLKATGGVSEMQTHFFDVAEYSYIWSGEEIITPGSQPGEISEACDCTYWRHNQYAIAHLDWDIIEGHSVGFSASPTWHRQSASNQLFSDDQIDLTDSGREMFSLVFGANYTLDFFNDKLQNQFFIKHYAQERESISINEATELPEQQDSNIKRIGWGNQLRYRFNDWFLGKLSYEQATRLPNFVEVFGNAESIIPNLDLKEEYSNNYNVSLEIDSLINDYGSWKGSANIFLRDVEDAITLMTENDLSVFENVNSVDSSGFQVSGAWTSPEDFMNIKVNFTKIDLINTADDGLFAQFKGERIPNRPHTFLNSKVGLKWMSVLSGYDELQLNWNYRFVDRFELIWENYGGSNNKPFVPSQGSHSLATSYTKDFYPYVVSVSAEIQNLTDDTLFDHYGVQRPGRAFYVKSMIEF